MKYLKYVVMYLVLIFVSKLYNKYKKYYLEDENIKHYNIVNKYLLNNNSLAKNNKPYLWIHNIFEINSNNWSSFGSRNTKCMNQPYKYMTIKSIIDKCSNDFNVCLGCDLETDTFNRLISDGYIAEFIVYNRKLTPIEMNAVESYLQTKWGL